MMPVQKPFWDYFWVAKYLFQAMGILSLGGPPSMWKSILDEFLTACRMACCFYVQIEPMNYILFQDHDMDDLFEAVIILLAMAGVQIRILFMTANHGSFESLFAACSKFWDDATPSDNLVTSTWAKRARLFITTYICASQIVPELFLLTSKLKEFSLPENSTTRFYPYGFADDVTPSPQFELKSFCQVMCVHVSLAVMTAADSAGILVALFLCGQLDLIRSWLLKISPNENYSEDGKTNEKIRVGLIKCIRRHQDVMNLCAELEIAMRSINLTQVLTGMYIFAISGARLMKNIKSIRNFGSLMTPIIGFFFSCWPADQLSSASSEVTVAIYDLPWYRCSPREKLAVLIMLVRSQRLAKLTAGRFVVLSLETFSSIMYNGFSFCMVLNSF